MDARHFDTLTRALIAGGTRRGLLRLLGAAPILDALLALRTDETAAKGGGKRRTNAHHHNDLSAAKKHKKKKHKKKCKPQSKSTTCEGKCGNVTNNCKQPVDCGACGCTPACGTGVCGSDAPDGCGGTMDCDACGSGESCVANHCEACGDDVGDSCCAGDTCPGREVLGCFAGTCQICGIFAYPCCPGDICFFGYSCAAGICTFEAPD